MKVITGNLLDLADIGTFDLIIHGCNCMNTMGAGIARQIALRYPRAEEVDKFTIMGSREKLGTWTLASINFYNEKIDEQVSFMVINAYTQYDWRHSQNQVAVDYSAVERIFTNIGISFSGLKMGYPMIGAGLAGGDWNIISSIIDKALEGEDHYLVRLP